jgi:hypothetical protein
MYLKFCGIEFDVNNINEPAASPSGKSNVNILCMHSNVTVNLGKLPFLATVSGAIYNDQETINWVKETRVRENKFIHCQKFN